MKNLIKYIFLLLPVFVTGQNDTLKGLQSDILLHPADGFTAYTLQKGEFVYNQSPFILPLPGWAWWGISDGVTVEIDLLPLVGGLFEKPYLPVPSFNFRFKILNQKRIVPTVSFETMYQHLWNEVIQSDISGVFVSRKGNSWFNRLNMSWKLSNRFHTHFSFGVTFVEYLFFSNKDSIHLIEKEHNNLLSPDISISLDYRMKPYISFHTSLSYGTTFVYLDNIPRKQQLTYGFRLAPFYKNKFGFLRNLRAEFIAFYIYLPDINKSITSLLPVFPYFYWQWNL